MRYVPRRELSIGILLAAVWLPVVSAGQAPVVESLRGRGVPVASIEVQASSAVATLRYGRDAEIRTALVSEHLKSTLTELSRAFPESATLVVATFVEDRAIGRISVGANDVRESLQSGRDGMGMLARAKMTTDLDLASVLASVPRSPAETTAEVPGAETRAPVAAPEVRAGSGATTPAAGGSVAWMILPNPPAWPRVALIALLAGSVGLFAAIVVVQRRKPKSALKIRARLDVLYEDGGTKSFVIRDPRTTIGRSDDNALILRDPLVSGHHAEITVSARGFELKDLASAHGTSLNGNPVSRDLIYLGDEITVGSTRIVLKDPEHESKTAGVH
jgi:hypothetical protein